MRKIINFLGIKIGALTLSEIVEEILDYAISGKTKFITYLNTHCVNLALSDEEYKNILNKSDLVYAGGQGVVWASGFLGAALPERLNILDFFDMLIALLRENNISLYLLGGTEAVVHKAAAKLRYKGINVAGAHNGFFTPQEERAIIDEINHLRPHILIVGMGVPKQEKWIYSHLTELDVNLCWAVGAAFDWLSGQRKRAPRWMIESGLEWLHRLSQQPKRLWKRYLLGNLIFAYRVIKYRFKRI